ncbi:hypothetical protein H9P43_002974 [Blastocladiella emersonii ATCC 22665]|nr:hypothetical protein H9P43_002958 [Blastocladiella emersonii ATCC 22665]KAI9183922.1 hypothetical protein H9P43_002974 [Blastocladiella emersonii ATCC 22665]
MISSPLRIALLVQLALILAALSPTADAHFTLQSPVASREKQEYPNDNRRYWPIAGGSTLRPVLDCLKLPRRQVATLAAGSTQVFGFEIGNNARHVGPCTAQLINLKTGATQDIGKEENCVNRRDAMTVKLPSTTCDECVVKIKVTATHLGANFPEFYDSCVDVKLTGGSGTAPGPNPPAPVPTDVDPAPSPSPSPRPNPRPRPPRPTATRNPGKGQQDPTPTSAPIPQPPSNGGNGDNGSCSAANHGQMVCGAGGKTIRQCVFDKWVDIPVAAGTKCVPSGNTVQLARA